jgi:hypothetical protein
MTNTIPTAYYVSFTYNGEEYEHYVTFNPTHLWKGGHNIDPSQLFTSGGLEVPDDFDAALIKGLYWEEQELDSLPSKEETDALLLRLRATLSPEQQAEFDEDMAAIHERMNEYTMKHIVK